MCDHAAELENLGSRNSGGHEQATAQNISSESVAVAGGRQYCYAASAPAEFYYAASLEGVQRRPRSLLSGQYLSRRVSDDTAGDPHFDSNVGENLGVGASLKKCSAKPSRDAQVEPARAQVEPTRPPQPPRGGGESTNRLPPALNNPGSPRMAVTTGGSPTLLSMLKRAPPGSYTDRVGRDGILSRLSEGGDKREGSHFLGPGQLQRVPAPQDRTASSTLLSSSRPCVNVGSRNCSSVVCRNTHGGGTVGMGVGVQSRQCDGGNLNGNINLHLNGRHRANSAGSAGSIDDLDGEDGDEFLQFVGDEMDDI